MTSELMALRDAVNNTCTFLGPGSRTGGKLEAAMLAAEQAAAQAPSTEHFDKGPWTYRTNPKADTHVGRYFVESDDFTHDVRLYVNGDFADDEARRAYGEALADTLNRAAKTQR